MPDKRPIKFTAKYDVESDEMTISGWNDHSITHLFDALLIAAGVAQVGCILDLHNNLADAYNAAFKDIPEQRLMRIDDAAEEIVRRVNVQRVLGLTPDDDYYPRGDW